MVQVYGEQGFSAQLIISFTGHAVFFICVGKQAPLVAVTGDVCLVLPTCHQDVIVTRLLTGYVILVCQHPESMSTVAAGMYWSCC